ncbi:general substrate transporter [Plectosphaerella plurivora]|uniref:General substrate transporter n=1 Tax=Plectosphaerella plurivora TaxID=936078 RepID=A0A9P8VLC9_9PEZI|nr:general substrate transporter [Plectosphaerella plurivora]
MGVLKTSNARYFNRSLLLSVILIAVSSFNYGFDNQAFATTQAMEPFQRQFGEYNAKLGRYNLPTDWLALFNSLNYVGFAAGVLIGGWVCDHFGRRWCMFSMSVYALVTATIAVTSNRREQIMAARVLNYVYVGMELSVVPLYQSEIVPAPVRGLVVGTYQWSLILGGVVINSICYGTSHFTDNRAWRIPLGFFYVVPSIIAACIFLVPESPRWLLRRGRVEEARASLHKLREGAFTEKEIANEFRELEFALDNESEKGKFVEVFQGVNLRRTLIVIAVNFFQQATGQAFSSQYGAVFVRSLRVMNPILFSLMTSCITAGTMVITLLLNDKTGRRVMLMLSSACMAAVLITMGGLGVQEPVPDNLKRGVVGVMALFGPSFALGWGPLCYVVATEVTSMRLRDKTSRIGFFVNVLFNFVVNYSIPYLVFEDRAGLGSKVGFIFGAISILSFVFVFFQVPECKGKTLEQVDWLFNNKVAMRDFGKTDTSGMLAEARADQKVDEEGDVEKGPSASVSSRAEEERVAVAK